MKKKISLIAFSALVMGSALFTSCKKEEEPKKYAKVNMMHAAPNSAAINFVAGGVTLNSDAALSYGNHTGYVNIEAGSRKIAYKFDGVDSAFLDSSFVFKENASYSLYMIDSSTPSKPKPMILVDDLSQPANGKANFRFVYLSPNGPEVDLVRVVGTNYFSVFPKVKYKDASSFSSFDAGVYNFELRLNATNVSILSIPSVVLNAGKIYTLVIRGIDGASGKTALKSDIFINKN